MNEVVQHMILKSLFTLSTFFNILLTDITADNNSGPLDMHYLLYFSFILTTKVDDSFIMLSLSTMFNQL